MTKNLKKTAIIALIISIGLSLSGCGTKVEEISEEPQLPQVSAIEVNKTSNIETTIKLTGKSKAVNKVSLVALNSGKVTSLPVKVGAEIKNGAAVIQLFDASTESNFSTALNSYTNAERALNNTELSSAENVAQAKLALENAKINLDLAVNNYNNQVILTDQSWKNALSGGIISAESALDTVFISLLTLNDILKEDAIPENVLGTQSPFLKLQADTNLEKIQNEYDTQRDESFTNDNIENRLPKIINLVSLTQTTLDILMDMLNNTPISNDFSQTSKESYISNIYTKQSSLASNQTGLQSAWQTITNTKVSNQSTLNSYLSQKTAAEIALETAKASLNSTEKNSDSQVVSSQTSYQRALNEYNQAAVQRNRLTITSPLSGVLSKLNVEVGDEVSLGQIVGEVSQTQAMEIDIDVSPEVASTLLIGDEVKISGNETGIISQISPTPDDNSGKVNVKITQPNESGRIISDSFVNVELTVKLPASQESVYIVPLKSVYLSADSAKVKIVEEDKLKTITVKTGKTVGEMIEILEGLTDGQKIVTDGADFLSDETEVSIVEN